MTTPALPAVPGNASPWHVGKVDADTLGHMQNRGWHEKSAEDVAIAAMGAHREAERLIGVPANEMLRIPKQGAPEADIKAFWGKLGAPPDAKDYDLSSVTDQALSDALRGAAAKAFLPKDTAKAIADAVVAHQTAASAAAKTEQDASIATAKTDLAKNWGANHDANLFVAKQAATALGVTPDQVSALEKAVGYAGVMEMFRNIGAKIGEDKFVRGENPAGPGIMTREQAVAKKSDLMTDKAWTTRYLAGGKAEQREMTALNTLIVAQ